jgi:hypothetical protein
MATSFQPDQVVPVPWRPERPQIRVTENMIEALVRLRPALIVVAKRRSTLTYGEAETVIDGLIKMGHGVADGGRLLDLITVDCERRREPSLAALVVRSDTGEVGDGFVGDAGAGREDCYRYWSTK